MKEWIRAGLPALLLLPLLALAQVGAEDDRGAAEDFIDVPPPPPLPPLNSPPSQSQKPQPTLGAPPVEGVDSAEIPQVPQLPPPRVRSEDAGDAPLPPKAVTSEELVPAVVIRTDEEGQRVEEYSVNGRIYMVRVTPTVGPVYYLFDVDGDGEMETREFESDPGIKPVHWKLLEWD